MSSVISKGYTPCEYIESSGTQYIDTGFTPTSKTKVIYDFAYTSLVSQYSGIYVDGARLLFGLNTRLEVYLGSTTNTSLTATTNRQTIVFDIPNKTALVNGTTVLQNISYTPKAYTLPIFAMRNGSGISNYSYFKLYSCQIYDDNVLIMDFKPCKNINGVYGLFDEVNNVFYTTPTGAFTGKAIYSGIQFNRSFRRRMLTQPPKADFASQYFTMEILTNGTVSFSVSGIKYSKDDGKSWVNYSGGNISVSANEKILCKSTLGTTSGTGMCTFQTTCQFNVYGNIMSLLFGDNFKGQTSLANKKYAFNSLLHSNKYLIDASNLVLPATILSTDCYNWMFANCTSLISAPAVIPDAQMADYCCYGMFYNCTSLISAPKLMPTKLQLGCYYHMFYNCIKLNKITMLATDISASNCLDYWVDRVSSTGTFVKHPNMTRLPTGKSGIPNGWTVVNASV